MNSLLTPYAFSRRATSRPPCRVWVSSASSSWRGIYPPVGGCDAGRAWERRGRATSVPAMERHRARRPVTARPRAAAARVRPRGPDPPRDPRRRQDPGGGDRRPHPRGARQPRSARAAATRGLVPGGSGRLGDAVLAPEQRAPDAQRGQPVGARRQQPRGPAASIAPSRRTSPTACRQPSMPIPAAAAASARISGIVEVEAAAEREPAGGEHERGAAALLGRVGRRAHRGGHRRRGSARARSAAAAARPRGARPRPRQLGQRVRISVRRAAAQRGRGGRRPHARRRRRAPLARRRGTRTDSTGRRGTRRATGAMHACLRGASRRPALRQPDHFAHPIRSLLWYVPRTRAASNAARSNDSRPRKLADCHRHGVRCSVDPPNVHQIKPAAAGAAILRATAAVQARVEPGEVRPLAPSTAPQASPLRPVVARRPRARPRRRQVDAADHPRPRRRPAPVRRAAARAARHLDRAAALAPEPHGRRRPAHPPALPRGAAARGLRADRALARADAGARRARPLGLRLDLGRAAPGRGRQRRRDLPARARDAHSRRRTCAAPSSSWSTRAAICPSAASSSRSPAAACEITEHDETESEPDARVTGPVSAWVHALGPEGAHAASLHDQRPRALADAVLDGFAHAGARRAAAAA